MFHLILNKELNLPRYFNYFFLDFPIQEGEFLSDKLIYFDFSVNTFKHSLDDVLWCHAGLYRHGNNLLP